MNFDDETSEPTRLPMPDKDPTDQDATHREEDGYVPSWSFIGDTEVDLPVDTAPEDTRSHDVRTNDLLRGDGVSGEVTVAAAWGTASTTETELMSNPVANPPGDRSDDAPAVVSTVSEIAPPTSSPIAADPSGSATDFPDPTAPGPDTAAQRDPSVRTVLGGQLRARAGRIEQRATLFAPLAAQMVGAGGDQLGRDVDELAAAVGFRVAVADLVGAAARRTGATAGSILATAARVRATVLRTAADVVEHAPRIRP